MTFPDFAEFQAYLRATEPDLKKLASIKHLYQIDQMSPENVSAFASSIAEDTLTCRKCYGAGVSGGLSSVARGLFRATT